MGMGWDGMRIGIGGVVDDGWSAVVGRPAEGGQQDEEAGGDACHTVLSLASVDRMDGV